MCSTEMDEFTLGTSTIICMKDRAIRMVTERVDDQSVVLGVIPDQEALAAEEDAKQEISRILGKHMKRLI